MYTIYIKPSKIQPQLSLKQELGDQKYLDQRAHGNWWNIDGRMMER